MRLLPFLFFFLPIANPVLASEIFAAQEYLSELGYKTGVLDGKMGPQTSYAMEQFLGESGSSWDGIIDASDIDALRAAIFARRERHAVKTSADDRQERICHSWATGEISDITKVQRRRHDLVDAAGRPANAAYWGTFALADLGGDGSIESLNFVHGVSAPLVPMPVLIQGNYISATGAAQFGIGGQFNLEVTGLEINRIAVDDLNGDGVDDLVFADYGNHNPTELVLVEGGSISVALSQPDGKYIQTALSAPTILYHDLVTADLDLDGDKDIIGVGGHPHGVRNRDWVVVLENAGDGTFTVSADLSLRSLDTWAVTATDLDADGLVDLLVGKNAKNPRSKPIVDVHWGGSTQITSIPVDHGQLAVRIGFGDLDDDGTADIVFNAADGNYTENIISKLILDGRELKTQSLFHWSSKMGGVNQLWDIEFCNGTLVSFLSNIGQMREISQKTTAP